jgi:AcrR family transcriptional regulator
MRMQEGSKRLTRAEQKARTRDRLVAAAARVIGRRGMGAASVDEISEDAGYSSGAFYANFESKEDAFAAALEYHAEEFARFLGSRRAEGSATSRLSADGEWLARLDDWQVLFWLEIVAQGGRSPQLKPVVRDYFARARQRLEGELEEGARESGRPLPAPAGELATLVIAAELGLFVQRIFDHDAVSPELLGRLVELLAGDAEAPAARGR